MKFYPEVGVKRDVNSKPEAENYALRGLLSVRYTLVAKDKETEWTDKALPGWRRTGETTATPFTRTKTGCRWALHSTTTSPPTSSTA